MAKTAEQKTFSLTPGYDIDFIAKNLLKFFGITAKQIDVAIITGTAGPELNTEDGKVMSYSSIHPDIKPLVGGHEGLVKLLSVQGKLILVFQGRQHFYENENRSMTVLIASIIAKLGIPRVVLTNAAGAIGFGFNVGDIAVIEDFNWADSLDPLTGRSGGNFLNTCHLLDKEWIRDAKKEVLSLETRWWKRAVIFLFRKPGAYYAVPGPAFETPLRINMLRTGGVNLVGMSTVPEILTLGFLNPRVKILAVSMVTNVAGPDANHEEHRKVLLKNGPKFKDFILKMIEY